MNKKIAIQTYGCRANQYDSAVIVDQLQNWSFDIVDVDQPADVYILNSCTITHRADAELKRFIRRLYRKYPGSLVLVTGCAASVSPKEYEDLKGVHFVVGNQDKDQIIKIIKNHFEAVEEFSISGKDHAFSDIFFGGGVETPHHSRSFLKIQDGCSQFCSYCIVPFARGLNRSVDPSAVMDSLYTLKEKGVDEVVITGIHLGTYGNDLSPRTSFYKLLERMERERPVSRIRLSSLDPEEVSDEMIDLFSSTRIFCPHLHLPLQSGDDGILKKMRRRYSGQYFVDLCEKLDEVMPQLCIGTDVIVGFPGETEEAFNNTMRILQESPIAYVHTFPYSPRQGTKAVDFAKQVSAETRKQRSHVVRQLSDTKRFLFHKRFEGENLDVILEKRKTRHVGLTQNYISVEIDGENDYRRGLAGVLIKKVTRDRVQGVLI